jgi:hypothetical protein
VHVGGVYAANGTVENCVITNNTGGNACCVGGVYLAGTSRLINSLVAGNSIPYDSYSKDGAKKCQRRAPSQPRVKPRKPIAKDKEG